MSRKKQLKPPKFKVGDMVFSWQNPTVKRRVSHVRPSNDPKYQHQYVLALYDKDGYSYSSKQMGEASLSFRRRKKE